MVTVAAGRVTALPCENRFDSNPGRDILSSVIDEENPPGRLQQLLRKSQTMADELVKENERLRLRVAELEEQYRAAEQEVKELRSLSEFPRSAVDIEEMRAVEEELNTLANLHTANWQLHLQLALSRVLDAIIEICVNLVGANGTLIYMVDEKRRLLVPVRKHNCDDAGVIAVDGSEIAKAVMSGEIETPESGEPVAVVPLSFEERAVGAVVIQSLLVQKKGLERLDHVLFDLIRRQGATALYGAYLAGVSPLAVEEQAIRKALSG